MVYETLKWWRITTLVSCSCSVFGVLLHQVLLPLLKNQREQKIAFISLKAFCSVPFFPARVMEKGDLRWWEELPDFSLSNLNAKTRKETKEITFLKFLRQGLHHSNNEEFWKIRSRVHTSCGLSSKYIFWLNFLCRDFPITDAHHSWAVKGAALRASALSERTGETPAGQASLEMAFRQIFSPCS